MTHDNLIKLTILVLFFGSMIAVGLYCRRHSASVDGFILGGRSVGAWLTAFAYGTSYFSAVILVGYSGQFGWKYGIASTWIGLGNALIGSYMAWALLGRRTRVMTQHLGSWLALTKTPDAVSEEITRRMRSELGGGDETGFSPYMSGGGICFDQRWVLMTGRKE